MYVNFQIINNNLLFEMQNVKNNITVFTNVQNNLTGGGIAKMVLP